MEKDYDILDECDWEIRRVSCDDYGDTAYKYWVLFYHGDKLVYDDYFMSEPDDRQCYNTLLESYKNGATQL